MTDVCVVTGSRAEYGLLTCFMKGVQDSPFLNLQLVVTGMHLSSEFGQTWREIDADGFDIDWKVDMLLGSDSPVAVTKSVGVGTSGFADAFAHLKPGIVVLLGDRFEILAAASAALLMSIPIAHLHGGEITEGAYDDSIRHCVTKMATLHFTAAEPYRSRVIQLGESPDRVWNVGAFGLDALAELERIPRGELEDCIGLNLDGVSLLVTFHPETASENRPEKQMRELLAALDRIDAKIVFTLPNADTGGRILFQMIRDFVLKNPMRSCVHASLGQQRYLSLLHEVDAVVGNSSSGLIEVPSLHKPTVNIGQRQQGRLRAASVIDCQAIESEIVAAIKKALDSKFQESLLGNINPYGTEGASRRTVQLIEEFADVKPKSKFFDLSAEVKADT